MESHKRSHDGENSSGPDRKKTMKTAQNGFEAYKEEYMRNTPWRGNVLAKLNSSDPFNFFLTRISDSYQTYSEDLTISFPELLDSSLGELTQTLHINFMVDLSWLLAQYMIVGYRNPKMTICHGEDDPDLERPPSHLNLKTARIKSPYPFGHHHSKMSIFYYKDKSVRVAIYTANLIESDWDNRTQGIWISPLCRYLGDEAAINEGESETYFKYDLIKYLNSYKVEHIHEWIRILQKSDLSDIRVYLVASVPGEDNQDQFGHKKLSRILKENVKLDDRYEWELISQCSSIGSLGKTPDTWFCGDFSRSLSSCGGKSRMLDMTLIYPSVSNVRQSHDGMLGGSCLPYCSSTHEKQPWLRRYLQQWKSEGRSRSKAVPHIKTYACVSTRDKLLAWFLVTSANLSKAAWGVTAKNGGIRPMSWEVGVLFLPSILINKNVFKIKQNGDFSNNEEFPLPYDFPLTKYEQNDQIFLYDKCFSR